MNSSPSNIKHRIFLVRLLVIVFISIGFTVSAATKDFEDSTHVEYPDWFVKPFSGPCRTAMMRLQQRVKKGLCFYLPPKAVLIVSNLFTAA